MKHCFVGYSNSMKASFKALNIVIMFFAFFVVCLFSVQVYYPTKYMDHVKTYAAMYDVPESLVFAIMHTESKFNAKAVSSKGAVGLMQILPTTGTWVAEKIQYKNFTENDLLIPQINIQFGCFYLSYLLQKFHNEDLAICAYNAGEGKVSNWLHDDNFRINHIPIEETRVYLHRVQFAEKIYNIY